MSRDTEHLRHEIEETRERMSETLDQLGDRLNPNRIKRQVKENIREATVGRVENMARHAADRVHETRDGVLNTIRDNPIPAAMIGIGLGWMLFGGRRSDTHVYGHARDLSGDNSMSGRGYVGDITATTPRLAQDDAAEHGVMDRVRDTVSHVRDSASGIIDSGREHLDDAAHRTGERVSEVASKVGDAAHRARFAVTDVAATTRLQAHRAEERLQRTLEDNPLAVGAVALAVGLAAGFAIPESRREAQLMGPTRDRLVDRAREMAGVAKERVQEVAERVVDEVASGDTSRDVNKDTSTMM